MIPSLKSEGAVVRLLLTFEGNHPEGRLVFDSNYLYRIDAYDHKHAVFFMISYSGVPIFLPQYLPNSIGVFPKFPCCDV